MKKVTKIISTAVAGIVAFGAGIILDKYFLHKQEPLKPNCIIERIVSIDYESNPFVQLNNVIRKHNISNFYRELLGHETYNDISSWLHNIDSILLSEAYRSKAFSLAPQLKTTKMKAGPQWEVDINNFGKLEQLLKQPEIAGPFKCMFSEETYNKIIDNAFFERARIAHHANDEV